MMFKIKKVLIFIVFTLNILFTQYPAAAFSYNEYLIGQHLENYTISLEIENPDSLELWAYTIYLYANPEVIKLTDANWHSDSPFQYTDFQANSSTDTLKISTFTSSNNAMYSGEGGKILDITFEIVGEPDDSTLLEFIRFEIADSYLANTTSTNIILVGGVNCNNPIACNYNEGSSSDIDCIYIEEGKCDCEGNIDLGCGCNQSGPTGCDNVCGSTLELDECSICGGDNSLCSDCAGVPNGEAYITPCGDCSDISNCDISVSVATMDNNYRSETIEVPVSLLDYENFSSSDLGSSGLQGIEFIINFDSDLLELNAERSKSLLDNYTSTFTDSDVNPDSVQIACESLFSHQVIDSNRICKRGTVYIDPFGDGIYEQSLEGPFAALAFDVIKSRYNSELDGIETEIHLVVEKVNTVELNLNGQSGILTLFTQACIDPFASTIIPASDSNFICDVDADVCDENGILDGSDIFNSGCNMPIPNVSDILSIRNDSLETVLDYDGNFTVVIPPETEISLPTGETSLDLFFSDSVDISFLPDVAPGAQLAGPLVGIYPFGATFDPPIEMIFDFEALSRGDSEYKILYMDDIQSGDWDEIGLCSVEELGKCNIEQLTRSGLFIVMYGENLQVDELTVPTDFGLFRNYPNPFNPITTLEFNVPISSIVRFTIYNVNGQIVDALPAKFYNPGNYSVIWDAQNFSTGIYLIQMETQESLISIHKIMLLK